MKLKLPYLSILPDPLAEPGIDFKRWDRWVLALNRLEIVCGFLTGLLYATAIIAWLRPTADSDGYPFIIAAYACCGVLGGKFSRLWANHDVRVMADRVSTEWGKHVAGRLERVMQAVDGRKDEGNS